MEKTIGFLFPGQGSQYVGMGKDIFAQDPKGRQIFEKADSILGYSISKMCFEGPESTLTRTSYAQPAIFVMSMAVLAVLKSIYPDLVPKLSVGLSLGEFSALVAIDAISFEEGLKLVQKRAEAMEISAQRHPGTMASIIGLTENKCAEIAQEAGCEVANINSPDQIALSGTRESIERACKIAESKGAKRAVPLNVGGAFHSSLMREAKEDLEKALESTSIHKPKSIFIPNALGKPTSDPQEIRSLLAKQLISSVRWVETMARSKEAGVLEYIEIGCGKILNGLARKCQPEFKVQSCGTMAEFEKLSQFLNPQIV